MTVESWEAQHAKVYDHLKEPVIVTQFFGMQAESDQAFIERRIVSLAFQRRQVVADIAGQAL